MKQVRLETGVCHFRIEHPTGLHAYLATADLTELELKTSPALARNWLYEGSVYVDGQRAREDVQLNAQQIVRLHTRRKRYPAAALGNWRERIVAETADFLVFDKPSGLPTHATLDNYVENAKFVLETELGTTLYTTHRLDIPTCGLLIVAKTAVAQSRINKVFARGQVEKRYHALSHVLLPLGSYTHYIDPSGNVPRPIGDELKPGWWECRLEIEAHGECANGYWHRVRLLTGKTHQIRAQLTALGAPLLGDIQYGGRAHEFFGLECYELAFFVANERFRFVRPQSFV